VETSLGIDKTVVGSPDELAVVIDLDKVVETLFCGEIADADVQMGGMLRKEPPYMTCCASRRSRGHSSRSISFPAPWSSHCRAVSIIDIREIRHT